MSVKSHATAAVARDARALAPAAAAASSRCRTGSATSRPSRRRWAASACSARGSSSAPSCPSRERRTSRSMRRPVAIGPLPRTTRCARTPHGVAAAFRAAGIPAEALAVGRAAAVGEGPLQLRLEPARRAARPDLRRGRRVARAAAGPRRRDRRGLRRRARERHRAAVGSRRPTFRAYFHATLVPPTASPSLVDAPGPRSRAAHRDRRDRRCDRARGRAHRRPDAGQRAARRSDPRRRAIARLFAMGGAGG